MSRLKNSKKNRLSISPPLTVKKCPVCGYKFRGSIDRAAHQCPEKMPRRGVEPRILQGGLPGLGKKQ